MVQSPKQLRMELRKLKKMIELYKNHLSNKVSVKMETEEDAAKPQVNGKRKHQNGDNKQQKVNKATNNQVNNQASNKPNKQANKKQKLNGTK